MGRSFPASAEGHQVRAIASAKARLSKLNSQSSTRRTIRQALPACEQAVGRDKILCDRTAAPARGGSVSVALRCVNIANNDASAPTATAVTVGAGMLGMESLRPIANDVAEAIAQVWRARKSSGSHRLGWRSYRARTNDARRPGANLTADAPSSSTIVERVWR